MSVIRSPTRTVQQTEAAARALGVEVLPVEAPSFTALQSAFSTQIRGRVHGVVVTADAHYVSERARISILALQAGLPTMYWTREFAEVGGLMTYGTNVSHLYRRAATYVDEILKGARPSDLPVEQPTVFDFVVNLKSAKALSLTMPSSVLIRADEIIQ